MAVADCPDACVVGLHRSRNRASGVAGNGVGVVRVRRDWSRPSHSAGACQRWYYLLAQGGKRSDGASMQRSSSSSGGRPTGLTKIHFDDNRVYQPVGGGITAIATAPALR